LWRGDGRVCRQRALHLALSSVSHFALVRNPVPSPPFGTCIPPLRLPSRCGSVYMSHSCVFTSHSGNLTFVFLKQVAGVLFDMTKPWQRSDERQDS
jgi:hypothetical protein